MKRGKYTSIFDRIQFGGHREQQCTEYASIHFLASNRRVFVPSGCHCGLAQSCVPISSNGYSSFVLKFTVCHLFLSPSQFSLTYNNNNNNNRIQTHNLRFLTIFSLCRKLSPTRTLKWAGCNCVQIMCNTSSAYHMQHVVLHATWYKGTAQLLSLTEFKSHLFELYFIG